MNSPVISVCTGTSRGLMQFHVWGFFSFLPFSCPLRAWLFFGIGHGSWRLPFNPTMEPAEFLWICIQSLDLWWYLGNNLYHLSPASKPLPKSFFFFWTCRSLEGEDCSLFGVGFSSSPVPGRFLFVLREEKAIREFAIILQPLRCMLVAFTVVLSCDFIWVTPLFPLKLLMCHPFFWPFWLAALNQV